MSTPFQNEPNPQRKHGRFSGLRTSFLTGLVVIAPVGFTLWLIWTVVGWVDGFVLPLVPDAWHLDPLLNRVMGNWEYLDPPSNTQKNPEWIDINLRGVGVIVFLVFTVIVGWVAKGLIGRSLIRFAESLVDRMPVIRTIYSGVKQIAETVFAQSERNFENACLVEYPRRGIWAIGFISTSAKGEIQKRAGNGEKLVSVFLPTTPNPTSGFLLFFPLNDVILLDMSVEDAAKLVISAGLVYPGESNSDK
ncbi:MAG: DUF502 domain-containing protein [Roseovarius sp.]|nr:DUF502 domain-containing protein [Roseovarius sp.]MCY4208360.1 DUF502 domain-containing protein [Roseovarius sp.]MCY4291433.1 DUF502 domain-containing protein [Roseovarius sp.]MCY4316043.1 DUF502 domain-containing protein [Roseovarius sp.]